MNNHSDPVYLILHGHFYQPPRENPWTNSIERQTSANPDHDWNERIAHQCYIPNTCSRLLDPNGRILRILNNYEYINFGFGPLLLAWMEREYPEAYRKILEADKLSMARNNGHGNAIAQVYNHVILPLSNRRDKLTQIRWGKADFKQRFGREPESIWLAETAINRETVECLIQENIRYVILSPHQALRVRTLEDEKAEWKDVSRGDIETGQAYRIFPKDDRGQPTMDGHLDVFFYNGALAHGISFAHFLRDAKNLAQMVTGYAQGGTCSEGPRVVSAATDGEIYGHHEPFGDMCLAALFGLYSESSGIEPVNYGFILEKFPPKMEAELHDAQGEGSSWSCAHGVGRWTRDCGCSTGAGAGWNQRWRTPLRRAFERLKAEGDLLLEREGSKIFRGPWQARDAYVDVIASTDRKKSMEQFFASHLLPGTATASNRAKALCLLEAQRMIQFSFTSCAWFFADISGIETVQNMIFAARAIELLQPYTDTHLELLVLNELKEAQSNVDGKNGKDIYIESVRSVTLDPVRAAALFAFESLLLGLDHGRPIYEYQIRPSDVRAFGDTERKAVACTLEVEEKLYGSIRKILCTAYFDGHGHAVCHTANERAAEIRRTLDPLLAKGEGILEHMSELFPGRPLRLDSLLFDKREQIGHAMSERHVQLWEERSREFTEMVIEQARVLAQCGPVISGHIRPLLECILSRRFLDQAGKYVENASNILTPPLWDLSKLAKALDVRIDKTPLVRSIEKRIHSLLSQLHETKSSPDCKAVQDLVQFANDFQIPISKREGENRIYEILEGRAAEWICNIHNPSRQAEEYNFVVDVLALADAMNLNTESYRSAFARVRP